MRPPLRYYVIAMGLSGPAAAALWAALGGWRGVGSWGDLVFFLIAGCVLDALTVPIARGGELSAGFAAFLAALIVLGPLPAAAAAALAVLCEGLLKRRALPRVLFNAGHTVLALLGAGLVCYGSPGSAAGPPNVAEPGGLVRVGLAAMVIMLIEVSAVSAAVSLDRGLPLRRLWLGTARQVIPVDVALAGLGLLVAIAYLNQRQIFGAAGWTFSAVVLLVPSGLLYYASRLRSDMFTVYDKTLRTFAALVEVRLQAVGAPERSAGHGARVAALAGEIASKLPLTADEVQAVHWAGELHDIGKVAMPIEAWQAASSCPEEAPEMTGYAETGFEMLHGVEFLRLVSLLVRYHERPCNDPAWQERITGPERDMLAKALPAWRMTEKRPVVRWDEPPADLVFLGAQILHAADYYDSASGEAAAQVMAYMESESGRKFHPDVIAAMRQSVAARSAGRAVHAD